MFKVNDYVIISKKIKDIYEENIYNTYSVVKSMLQYAGYRAKIVRKRTVCEKSYYYLDIDHQDHFWRKELLENANKNAEYLKD